MKPPFFKKAVNDFLKEDNFMEIIMMPEEVDEKPVEVETEEVIEEVVE